MTEQNEATQEKVSRSRRSRRSRRGAAPPKQEASEKKDAPTPSRRDRQNRNVVMRGIDALVSYFRETWVELNKVTWPDRDEALKMTAIVLAVMAASAVILGVVNLFYTQVITFLVSL
jgi:preprotein translocase subunit SecE